MQGTQRKLLAVLTGLGLMMSAQAHPAWLHKKVEGDLHTATLLEIDYTTRILTVAFKTKDGPQRSKNLKLVDKAKLAVLVSTKLDSLEEFKFVKLEGQSVDGQRGFQADTLTVLPDWFPEEPGFRETTASGVFRRSRKGTIFIQAKRRMTQIRNPQAVQVFQFEEREEIFALRKGQQLLLTLAKFNGLEAATAVCVLPANPTP